jgi:hypothetical protein
MSVGLMCGRKETSMPRFPLLLLILLLAGCSDDSMTRNFTLSRDSAPENAASTRMPLSVPPELAVRPEPRGPFDPEPPSSAPAAAAGPTSAGQEALVEAAGPDASSDIRTVINAHAGLVYPGPAFTDELMNWRPPAGYTPVITQGAKGSWLSRML